MPAEILRWDEAPEDFEQVKLRLEFGDNLLEVRTKDGYFRALCALREQIESSGMLLECYGASENVYPSPMIEAMGYAEKAYKQVLGKPALSADLVSIFDVGPDVIPSTVAQQREFHERWLKSLR
jgi:hypothetical protein